MGLRDEAGDAVVRSLRRVRDWWKENDALPLFILCMLAVYMGVGKPGVEGV